MRGKGSRRSWGSVSALYWLLGIRISAPEKNVGVVRLPWWASHFGLAERITNSVERDAMAAPYPVLVVRDERSIELRKLALTQRGSTIITSMRASGAFRKDDPTLRLLEGLPLRVRDSFLLQAVVNRAAGGGMTLDNRARAWIIGQVDEMMVRASMEGVDLADQWTATRWLAERALEAREPEEARA